MVALSQRELAMIEQAAMPLERGNRQPFIDAVMNAIERDCPCLGDGSLHRIIVSTQRAYRDPPSDSGRHAARHHG